MVWITGHSQREIVHYCGRKFVRVEAAFGARASLRANIVSVWDSARVRDSESLIRFRFVPPDV